MVGLMAFMVGSCSLFKGGGGKPTSHDPGGFSTATGLAFNEGDTTFKVHDFQGQPDGPNLVYIEGGRMVLGSFEEDILQSRDNLERTVTVASFYMDETEISNFHWCEYLYWLRRTFDQGFPMIHKRALPDTLSWREKLGFNEKYVEYYLRHPRTSFKY